MKKTFEQLLETPRMYYADHPFVNSIRGLNMLIEDHVKEDFKIAEVGSFSGVSSETLAQKCKELHCIDAWSPYWEINNGDVMKIAEANFDKMAENYQNIKKVKLNSSDAAQQYPDHFFDLIYIDAAHDYANAKRDITVWLPKLKKGGVMAGHDYRYDTNIQVYEVVEEFFGNTHKIEKYPDSSWAVQI